jgi:hypothetical protein
MKFIHLLFFFLILSATAFAQKIAYSSLTIPEELKKDANDVVRLDYTKLSVASMDEASLHVRYVVTLLNNQSKKHFNQVAYDKNSKISAVTARVYDAFGRLVREYDKKDFADQSAIGESTMYSDSRVKYIELSHNSYPFTVEFEYVKTFKGVLYYPDCYIQGFNSSLENLEFIVEMPVGVGLDLLHKPVNIDLTPEISLSGKNTTLKWTVNNRPAIKKEDFMPSPDEVLPHIRVSPRFFQYDKYSGDATSWQSFGKFFHQLNSGRDVLSPEMAGVVKKLTEGLNTNQEKIEVLYRYLQENTR